MQSDEIKRGIEALGPWFHQVQLPEGMLTKTESHFGEDANHPLPVWEHVKQAIPEDLTGKSVLDVGCNAGFYCFAAHQRGARTILGVDAVRRQVQQARFCAKALGLNDIHFERRSLYELDPLEQGEFDVVLALGLAYHLKHLVGGLERLFSMTSELLILESAVLVPEEELPAGVKEPLQHNQEQMYLLGYAKNSPMVNESSMNWFYPTAEGFLAMLSDVGFEEVQIVDRWFDRVLITGKKPAKKIDSCYPAYLRAKIEPSSRELSAQPGKRVELTLKVTNVGTAHWRPHDPQDDKGAVAIGGHLMSEDNPLFESEGRFPWGWIPHQIAPGESITVQRSFNAPDEPGSYLIETDLSSHHVAYFQDSGSIPERIKLTVSASH